VHSLSVADMRSIAQARYPDLDFSEDAVITDEIEVVLGVIQFHVTPKEQALGHFTCHKLKTLNMRTQWCTGEHKQLDHFHALKMLGSHTTNEAPWHCCCMLALEMLHQA